MMRLELADQFVISKATVSNTFVRWINLLYLRVGVLPLWPRWEEVRECMPEVFKAFYTKVLVIIDATKLECRHVQSL